MALAHVSFWLFLLFLPWAPTLFSPWGGHDASRLAQVLVTVVCASVLAVRTWRGQLYWPAFGTLTGRVLLSLLGALAACSVANAPSTTQALLELALFVSMVVVALTVAQTALSERWLHAYAAVIVSSMVLYGVLEIMICVAGLLSGSAPREGLVGLGYDNYRLLNHVQTAAIPLAALVAIRPDGTRLLRAGARVALATWFALLIFSGGRGTEMGLAIGLGAAAWVSGRHILPGLRQLLFGAASGVLLYLAVYRGLPWLFGLPDPQSLLDRVRDGNSVFARLVLWKWAGGAILEAPWVGIGPMHLAQRWNDDAAHPHNVYLQVAAEWGLPMLIVCLALIGRGLLRMVEAVRRSTVEDSRKAEGAMLLVAGSAVLMDGGVSGNFVMPMSQMWIALVAGLGLAWLGRGAADRLVVTGRVFGSSCFALCALLSCWVLVDQKVEISDMSAHLKQVNTQFPSPRSNPRFWSHGWF